MQEPPTPPSDPPGDEDVPATTASSAPNPQGASPLRMLGVGGLVVVVAWVGVLIWRLVR
jgi:hypothetical protein